MGTALDLLKPMLEDPAVLKIGQNIKYDISVFAGHDIRVAPIDDTMLLSFVLEAGKHNHGMDELSDLFLNHTPIPIKELIGTGKSQITFDQTPIDKATRYAAEDADVTFRLWERLKPRVACEGVAARASATRSESEMSTSWPTALTTGTRRLAMRRTTLSSLKAIKSSPEPPPLPMMTTSRPG